MTIAPMLGQTGFEGRQRSRADDEPAVTAIAQEPVVAEEQRFGDGGEPHLSAFAFNGQSCSGIPADSVRTHPLNQYPHRQTHDRNDIG